LELSLPSQKIIPSRLSYQEAKPLRFSYEDLDKMTNELEEEIKAFLDPNYLLAPTPQVIPQQPPRDLTKGQQVGISNMVEDILNGVLRGVESVKARQPLIIDPQPLIPDPQPLIPVSQPLIPVPQPLIPVSQQSKKESLEEKDPLINGLPNYNNLPDPTTLLDTKWAKEANKANQSMVSQLFYKGRLGSTSVEIWKDGKKERISANEYIKRYIEQHPDSYVILEKGDDLLEDKSLSIGDFVLIDFLDPEARQEAINRNIESNRIEKERNERIAFEEAERLVARIEADERAARQRKRKPEIEAETQRLIQEEQRRIDAEIEKQNMNSKEYREWIREWSKPDTPNDVEDIKESIKQYATTIKDAGNDAVYLEVIEPDIKKGFLGSLKKLNSLKDAFNTPKFNEKFDVKNPSKYLDEIETMRKQIASLSGKINYGAEIERLISGSGRIRISKKKVLKILKNKTTKSNLAIKQLDTEIFKILNS